MKLLKKLIESLSEMYSDVDSVKNLKIFNDWL